MKRVWSSRVEISAYNLQDSLYRSIDMAMAAQRNIPQDVVEEILVQLPFKSLVRFRSVSKQWTLLMSYSKFIEANEARAPIISHKNFFHSYQGNWEPYFGIIDCDIDGRKGVLRAVACNFPVEPNVHIGTAQCGGLVCLLNHDKVVVWNPSTNEHKKYPLYHHPSIAAIV